MRFIVAFKSLILHQNLSNHYKFLLSGCSALSRLFCSISVLLGLSNSVALAQNPLNDILGKAALMAAAKPWLRINSRIAFNQYVLSIGDVDAPEVVRKAQARLEKVLKRRLNLMVLRDQEFNAAAFPSGDMFINMGAIRHLETDEASIAFILGHEAAHVDREHGVDLFRQKLVFDAGLQALVRNNSNLSGVAGLLSFLTQMKYSRDHELEADRVGFVYAVKAGYDADAPARAMEVMKEAHKNTPSLAFFNSHPDTPERIKRLREYANAYRSGVSLELIQQGKLLKDVEREIGIEPTVSVSTSPFLDILMNLPVISYKKGETPDVPTSFYKKKEHPRFAIKAKSDGYLTILSRSPTGEVYSLLPNDYQSSGECHTGETILLPAPDYHAPKADFVRLSWKTKGDYLLVFVLTEQNWDTSALLHSKITAEEFKEKVEKAAAGAVLLEVHEQPISVER